MIKMKTNILILIGLILLLVLTACGTNTGNNQDAGQQTPDSQITVNEQERVADDFANELIDENQESDLGDII